MVITKTYFYNREYTINQGISPTLVYDSGPFQEEKRQYYVTYQALYQIGVFLSRSSISYFKVKQLWWPSVLQVLTLLLLLGESMNPWLPWGAYAVFLVICWEGLLGGAAYVNCYYRLTKLQPASHREFSLGVVGLADSLGITLAALCSMLLEGWLCTWKKNNGLSQCPTK